uniref:Uncharacterized protein n=1 Tax=Knipowitschia caucasica TaxID=637954 RepID=A0AAV2MIB1_KNICA
MHITPNRTPELWLLYNRVTKAFNHPAWNKPSFFPKPIRLVRNSPPSMSILRHPRPPSQRLPGLSSSIP